MSRPVDLDKEMFGPGGDPLRETLQHITARRFLIRTEPGREEQFRLPSARAPNGIRTRAAALKGRCPRPLDDGGAVGFSRRRRHQPAVGDGPSIGEDSKKQQSRSTAAKSAGIHDHTSGKDRPHRNDVSRWRSREHHDQENVHV